MFLEVQARNEGLAAMDFGLLGVHADQSERQKESPDGCRGFQINGCLELLPDGRGFHVRVNVGQVLLEIVSKHPYQLGGLRIIGIFVCPCSAWVQ